MSIRDPHRRERSADGLCLRIADILFALRSADSSLALQLPPASREFLVDAGIEADVTVAARWGDLAELRWEGQIFDGGPLWQSARQGDSYRFRFQTDALGPAAYKLASFEDDFTSGEVILHRPYFPAGSPVYPLEAPLDELLMVNLLARGRGVELHGCGLVDALGNGHLFLGQSGAGKSTMAGLWSSTDGAEILSDDRIVVRKLDGRLWMYGTPWHGEVALSRPARAPLTRVYFLCQAEQNELVEAAGVDAVARLFACCFPLFHSPEALGFTMGFLDDVAALVPCRELHFRKDEAVIDLLLQQEPGAG